MKITPIIKAECVPMVDNTKTRDTAFSGSPQNVYICEVDPVPCVTASRRGDGISFQLVSSRLGMTVLWFKGNFETLSCGDQDPRT